MADRRITDWEWTAKMYGRMSNNLPHLLQRAVIFGSLLLLCLQTWQVAHDWTFYQYDWRAYVLGAQLYVGGTDPYAFDALVAQSKALGLADNNHPFLYAPYMLWVFAPLALLPFQAAYFCWLGLQLAALGVVIWATLRVFRASPALTFTLMAVGLNGAVAAVLRSGQLTLIMTALLVLALSLIAGRRLVTATGVLTLAAVPKLWLAPMFGLLLRRLDRQRILLTLGGFAGFAAIIALGALIHPEHQAAFSGAVSSLIVDDRISGPQNGSALNALRTAFVTTGGTPETANVLWYGFVALVAAVALTRFVQTILQEDIDLAYLYSLIALSLSLAMPRLMIYQWCVALPALAYVITHMSSRVLAYGLLTVALIPTLYINRYAFGRNVHELLDSVVLVPWAFSNLAAAVLAWIVLVTVGPDMAKASLKPIGQD